jgi:holo-[acyl-carrier protein] synthase
MIEGIGIDIVDVPRFRRAIDKWGIHLLGRIFTSEELGYSRSKIHQAQHFAARFAVKEAVVKAVASGTVQGFRWKDVEVKNDETGKPHVILHGQFAKIAQKKQIHISITHTEQTVAAVAVIEI